MVLDMIIPLSTQAGIPNSQSIVRCFRSQFHETIPVDMTDNSAKELHRLHLAESERGEQCDVVHRRVALVGHENGRRIACEV